jgi:hypothetical protein
VINYIPQYRIMSIPKSELNEFYGSIKKQIKRMSE